MATAHTAHATYYLDIALVSQNQGGNYSTLNIHIYAIADSGWGSGSFASGIGWSCYGGSGAFNINGTSVDIANYNVNVGHDANGYCNYSITANVNNTGTSTYGGPISWTQTGSLPRIAKVPGAPGLTVNAPVGRNVTINITIPGGYDDGGATIQYLWSMYQKDGGAWAGGASTGWGTRTFSSLAPGTYKFRALAHNSVGDGPYTTQSGTVTVRSGGKVWDGSAWQPAAAKIWNGTTWVDATLKVYNGTSWVPVL